MECDMLIVFQIDDYFYILYIIELWMNSTTTSTNLMFCSGRVYLCSSVAGRAPVSFLPHISAAVVPVWRVGRPSAFIDFESNFSRMTLHWQILWSYWYSWAAMTTSFQRRAIVWLSGFYFLLLKCSFWLVPFKMDS